jgi:hypothetical protein
MQQKSSTDKNQQVFLDGMGRVTNSRKIALNKKLLIFFFFLLLSVIFWFITALSKNYNASISYPVRYIKLPEDKVLVSNPPDKLILSVNAQGYTLLRYKLTSKILPIIFDVNSFRLNRIPGKDSLNVYILTSLARNRIARQLSSDIELLEIAPDTLIFSFAEVIHKKLPVVPRYEIIFDKQFMQVGPVELSQDSVLASGPENILDTLQVAFTRKKVFRNANKTLEDNFNLLEIDKIAFSKEEIKVRIPVEKFTEASLNVPVRVINLPDNLVMKLFPPEIQVTCRVGLSDYEVTASRYFLAVVDFKEIDASPGGKLPVHLLEVPAYVQSVSFHPADVEYIIEK